MKKSTQSGFTVTELLVAATIATFLLSGVYTMYYYSNILTAKCVSINLTNVQSRNTMDQMYSMLQSSMTVPHPIDTSGNALPEELTTITGSAAKLLLAPVYMGSSSSTLQISATGAGIKFYRYVGGPYQATIEKTGLFTTASTITLKAKKGAQPILPQKYDVLAINSTAVMSGTGYQVWATVNGSPSVSTAGDVITYTVPLTGMMTDRSGTTPARTGQIIPYQVDSVDNTTPITCYTSLIRPTAFLFITPNGSTTTELRMYDPCILKDNNVNIDVSGTNYRTITRSVDSSTSTPPMFGVVNLEQETFVSAVIRTRSQEYDKYLANKQFDGFSTYMGFGTFIPLKSKP